MSDITYRTPTAEELVKLREIDRRETITGLYHLEDDALVFTPEVIEVAGFDNLDERIADLQTHYAAGGYYIAACDGERFVGLCGLDPHPRGARGNRLQLSGLWVSHDYRWRGIGRHLVTLAAAVAREQGATHLYISGTPSENTVRFYQSLGCTLTIEPDPELVAREPEDIHWDLEI